jgi:hypothetical protein
VRAEIDRVWDRSSSRIEENSVSVSASPVGRPYPVTISSFSAASRLARTRSTGATRT